jgi:hypothetical protein
MPTECGCALWIAAINPFSTASLMSRHDTVDRLVSLDGDLSENFYNNEVRSSDYGLFYYSTT